jgi:hypothetical protein
MKRLDSWQRENGMAAVWGNVRYLPDQQSGGHKLSYQTQDLERHPEGKVAGPAATMRNNNS